MNNLPIIDVLKVPVNPLTMSQSVIYLSNRVKDQLPTTVVTANAEIIMMGQKNRFYLQLLQQADLVLPDGAGTVWAGRTLGNDVPERVAGFDLFLELVRESANKGYRLFFFGSSPGVAEAARAKCLEAHPQVKIVGCRNGYFSASDEVDIVREINASKADILFVALGAPKQEFWLNKYKKDLKPFVRVGVGGSFDVLAGKMERAPLWMQQYSLEWLFRLYKQPKRFIRMLALPHFVLKVWSEKYLSNK